MTFVIVESPFAGDTERNIEYAQKACRDCFRRGEFCFASHLFYPQFLDDTKIDERNFGIQGGYWFWYRATKIAFYVDHGWSPGMYAALKRAIDDGKRPVARFIYNKRDEVFPGPTPDWLLEATANGFAIEVE